MAYKKQKETILLYQALVASTGVQFSAAHFQIDANKPKKMQKTAITMKWLRKHKV